jgi:hypothetical protein
MPADATPPLNRRLLPSPNLPPPFQRPPIYSSSELLTRRKGKDARAEYQQALSILSTIPRTRLHPYPAYTSINAISRLRWACVSCHQKDELFQDGLSAKPSPLSPGILKPSRFARRTEDTTHESETRCCWTTISKVQHNSAYFLAVTVSLLSIATFFIHPFRCCISC